MFQDALRRIPWESLSSSQKAKIRSVVSGHSIFRRMPLQSVYTAPDVYQFLVEHPDVVVGFWEKLGVTDISLKELEKDKFRMKETGGTTAVAEVLYRTKDLCIVYAKGYYTGPIFSRNIEGDTVLILRSRFLVDEDDEPYVVAQLDTFVRIDNAGADLIAKLLINVLGKIADGNFEQTIGFVGNVSEAATYNTKTVKRLSSEMKNVRSEVRSEFAEIADKVAVRGSKPSSQPLPEYAVIDYSASARSAELNPTADSSVSGALPLENEPSAPRASYSIPMPTISKLPKPPTAQEPSSASVSEEFGRQEVAGSDNLPLPIGVSTIGQDETPCFEEPQSLNSAANTPIPIGVSSLAPQPPSSRAVFRAPKVAQPQ